MSSYFIVLLFVYFGIQVLLSGPVLQLIVNIISFRLFKFGWLTPGIIMPGLWVWARSFTIYFPGELGTDIVHAKGSFLKFRISIAKILKGKLIFLGVNIRSFHMDYTNRVDSRKKTPYLPGRGRIQIKFEKVTHSSIDIEDRTLTPIFNIQIRDIKIENGLLDVGSPLEILFRSKMGSCRLGREGMLRIGTLRNGDRGYLNLSGITWGELAGLEIIPLPLFKKQVHLSVEFRHIDENHTDFEGTLVHSSVSPEEHSESYPFRFGIDWKEFNLPFDIALRKLIMELFLQTKLESLMARTLQTIAKGIRLFLGKE
ncbi:hypothetical protein LEP1GSC047_0981 [Leptospira inadai serovar Lyme str. 10]|uniref:Uncharacterized protein n=2 Tax=Leptospira inadai serovar Lyme TaxID=293084 RepID=V6HB03_9LEPT|nr:hypothetical protein [Leptospira inadai]EQA35688.1 hypothetical protein LEP1GSC047_0981 [Leptospira inadai serovar Lyme str. 10]PNV74190.1 hypothetical protein BES34_015195 [Leptospira inadai serovar Lyme]